MWGELKREANNEIIQLIKNIIHLLPPKCTIKICYNEILIIPLLTPPEHHELYYMLKQAGLLEEFITYGRYKLSRHLEVTRPPPDYPRLAYSSQENIVYFNNPLP